MPAHVQPPITRENAHWVERRDEMSGNKHRLFFLKTEKYYKGGDDDTPTHATMTKQDKAGGGERRKSEREKSA